MEYCNECKNEGCDKMIEMGKTRQAIRAIASLSKANFSLILKCDYYELDKDKLPKKESCCPNTRCCNG